MGSLERPYPPVSALRPHPPWVPAVTPGAAYCSGKLVRVVCDGPRPFCAGQHQDKLRVGFRRLGWKATVVRDFVSLGRAP
jgi:hypothetical protein